MGNVLISDKHPNVYRVTSNNGRRGVFVPFELIDLTGNHASAILLSQMMYWAGVVNNRWFYKSANDWQQELRMSENVVKRCIYGDKRAPKQTALIDLGIEVKVKRANGSPVRHFRIDYDKMEAAFERLLSTTSGVDTEPPGDNHQMETVIITKTLTESTTEKKEYPQAESSATIRSHGNKSESSQRQPTVHQQIVGELMRLFDLTHPTAKDRSMAGKVAKELVGADVKPEDVAGLVAYVRKEASGQWTVTMPSLTTHGRVSAYYKTQQPAQSTDIEVMTSRDYDLPDEPIVPDWINLESDNE